MNEVMTYLPSLQIILCLYDLMTTNLNVHFHLKLDFPVLETRHIDPLSY